MRGESGISLTGLYICGAISFVMLVLKLSVIDNWSWWRVLLPLGLFVGFNVINIVVAFIYLSFAHIPERPDGDEADVLEPHTINVHYVAAMLFFVVFGDNRCQPWRAKRRLVVPSRRAPLAAYPSCASARGDAA